jgi:hypothetical protein
MSSPLFANVVYTTLNGAVANGSTTSIVVSDASNFPSPGAGQYVPCVISDNSTSPPTIKEYVWATTVNTGTNTLTVTRAAEDSSRFPAAALASGLTISVILTKQAIADAGGKVYSVTSKTTTYTAANGDLVLADATSAAFTVTSPAATANNVFTVKKTDSSANAVTISPASGTIDGASSWVIYDQYSSFTFVSDGTNWFVA